MVLSHPLRDRPGDFPVVVATRAEGTTVDRRRGGAAHETRARILDAMDWLPHFGGSVLAIVDRGRVVATITGPHPAGWALTIEATRATTMHGSAVAARTAGEAQTAALADRDRSAHGALDVASRETAPRSIGIGVIDAETTTIERPGGQMTFRTRQTGTHRAAGSDGKTYVVLEFTRFTICKTMDGQETEEPGLKLLRLEDGTPVNPRDDGDYEIAGRNVRLYFKGPKNRVT